ncbi:hypothetical protein ACIGO8_23550 [Streptomyces sp. NPDC053493]|uniref:hypothetical protein n=1 Tax=Streptomyces sp. NPDC053493 TaxID=3365705 RepID=UPI0037D2EB5D
MRKVRLAVGSAVLAAVCVAGTTGSATASGNPAYDRYQKALAWCKAHGLPVAPAGDLVTQGSGGGTTPCSAQAYAAYMSALQVQARMFQQQATQAQVIQAVNRAAWPDK